MPFPALTVPLRRGLHRSRLAQIAIIIGFWQAGEAVVRLTGIALPGGIVGLALAIALLASGLVRLPSLRRGSDWFLAQMLLFFVPAVPAVMEHHELFGLVGLKVLAVILAGTAAVMGSTALTVELFHRRSVRQAQGHAPTA